MSKEASPIPHRDSSSDEDEENRQFPCSSILQGETPEAASEQLCFVSKRTLLAISLSVLCSVLVLVFLRSHLFDFLNWLQEAPLYETLIVFFILFTIVAFPVAFGYLILNVAAGYIYGFCWGMLVVVLSVAMGFTIAFFTCRMFLKNSIARMIKSSKLTMAFVKIVEGKQGLKVIILARLTPLPFGIQNSILAVTDMRYAVCLVGTLVGSLPMQCLNAYMGSTLRDMAEVLTHKADGYIILGLQIVVAVILSLYVVRVAHGEFKKLSAGDSGSSSTSDSSTSAVPPV